MKKTLITCALLALFVSPAALAAGRLDLAPSDSLGKTCVLNATNAGFGISASGKARLLSGPRGEAIAVKVEAKLDDKTMLIVSVKNNKGETFDVGAIHMVFGIGVWQMQSWKEISKAFPVETIRSISVRQKNTMLLVGACGGVEVGPKN